MSDEPHGEDGSEIVSTPCLQTNVQRAGGDSNEKGARWQNENREVAELKSPPGRQLILPLSGPKCKCGKLAENLPKLAFNL